MNQRTDLTIAAVERQHQMTLVLNDVEAKVKRAVTAQPFDSMLLMLSALPILLARTFHFFSVWLLLPYVILAAGALLLTSARRGYRLDVRRQLASSGLAERLAGDALDLGQISAATPAPLRFMLGLSAAQREGLSGMLETVALNVRWLLRPRQPYIPLPAQIVVVSAFGLGVMFGIDQLVDRVLPPGSYSYDSTAPLSKQLLAGVPMVGPLLLGIIFIGLSGSIASGKAAIAAQEFIAYLRQRLAA